MSAAGLPLLVALVLGAGVGSLSGFGGPGYEIALVTGIVLPGVVAVCSAFDAARRQASPFDSLARGVSVGAAAFGVSLLVSLVHGLRVGICDLWSGLQVLVLGPGIGLVLAGAWGWIVSELARLLRPGFRRGTAVVLLALAGPLGAIVVSLVRYYGSPMIFAYDPFVGYFSGTLYDTVIDYGGLLTYRLGSAATLIAVAIGAFHLQRTERGTARPAWRGRPGVLGIGALALVASIVITIEGPALGHWHTQATIEEHLGGTLEGQRCRVVYDRTLDEASIRRFASECEAHVTLNEAWWGARGPERITTFVFIDEAQKQRLMGASGTNIAKPWRAELYVQGAGFPHRVLGHELMHVIAASHGRGPFKVAGSWGGMLPDPGLIEGVAVAAAPKEDDLSPMEWARAMKDLRILPPLSNLFTLGFLGENSAMAYTVSGAFVGWVHDRHGAAAVRAWYGGADLREATGKSLLELERDWLAELDAIELEEPARIQARAKFDRPGFFARRCPRIVDGCRDRASAMTTAGDDVGALKELATARKWEPHNPNLRMDEAMAHLAEPPVDEGIALLDQIAGDESAPRFARDRALEELADHALSSGDHERAGPLYEEILGRTLDESKLRTLHVKLAACRREEIRSAIVTLLLGHRGRKPDRTAAAALLGVLDRERPGDGLAAYLLARYFMDSDDFIAASEHLERALARTLDIPRVRAEALRMRIVAASALAECDVAARWQAEYEKEPGIRDARKAAARRQLTLCRGGVESK